MSGPRIAIVGAGLMGGWHAYYALKAGASVVAIVDREPEAAKLLRAKHAGAKTFATLESCLKSSELDIVHICTDVKSHFDLASVALHGGKHILMEKPTARSAVEVKGLLELARSTGKRLVPVHQFPFQAGFRSLLRDLDRLGQLVGVNYHACSSGGEDRPANERREILLSILHHPLSLYSAILNGRSIGIDEAEVTEFRPDYLAINSIVCETHFATTISLEGRPTCNELTLTGTRATAYIDLFHGYCLVDSARTSRITKVARPFRFAAKLLATAGCGLLQRVIRLEPAYPGLGVLIGEFYASIRDGTAAPVGEDELVAIATAIDRVRYVGERVFVRGFHHDSRC